MQISGDGTDYLDLLHSYFVLDVKIVKADGSDLGAEDSVSLVNLSAQSLFSQVDVKLGDTLVSESNNLYMYRAMIESLLGFGSDCKRSQLQMSGYYKDTAGKMNELSDQNKGWASRKGLTNLSAVTQLMGRVHSDISSQDRYILNGVDVNLKFTRNSDAFVLLASTGSTFKVKITSASFYARKVKPQSAIQLNHIQKLDKENMMALYPVKRIETKTFSVPSGSLSANKEGLFTGLLPKQIVLGAVKSTAFEGTLVVDIIRYKVYHPYCFLILVIPSTGSVSENPYNFEPFDIKYLALYLDGAQIPTKPYQPDFGNKQYLRCYNTLFESTSRLFQNDGLDITLADYPGGYALFAFNLSADLSSDACYHLMRKG